MSKSRLLQVNGLAGVMLLGVSLAYADSAEVLPQGRYQLGGTVYFYDDIKKRYGSDGDKEDLAVDYNGALDSSVFPALAALDPLVPGGTASIGDSVVDFQFEYTTAEAQFFYGVTDKLSIGIKVPWFDAKNKVDATVNTATANTGKNTLYQSGLQPPQLDNSPVIPLGVPGAQVMSDQDVQDILGKGLDVNGDGTIDVPGLKYERFESYDDTGIGDIELKGKYKYYDKGDWRLAAEGGVRLRTGRQDDPDNLTDLAFGTGQNAILAKLYNDYRGIDNLLLSGTLEYAYYLETDKNLRIPRNVNEPITDNKENVDRDLGDIIQAELSGVYQFTPEWSAGLKYEFWQKLKTSVNGDKNFNYQSLEDETDQRSHSYIVSLSYSTIQRYFDKKTKIPLIAGISYRDRFAGKNNVNVSQYIAAHISLFF